MVFHHFTSSSKDEETDKGVAPNVASDNKNAVRDFWLKLQKELSAADEKDAAAFLLTTDNKLQSLLDIVFFKYWNTEQLRSKECERYISQEQSLRLFDDLVRGNEDIAIPTLKDYVKFKLVTGAGENDAIKEKKTAFVDGKKEAKGAEFDKKKKDDLKDKLEKTAADAKKHSMPTPLEILLAEAKAFEVDEEALKAAEEAVAAAKEAKDKKDNDRIQAPVEKAEKKGDEKGIEHAKAKAEEEKKKVEDAKAKAEEEVKAAGEKAAEAKKTSDEDRTKEVDAAGEAADGDFTAELKAAIDKALKKMDDEYKKKTFLLRTAAVAAFLEGTTDGLSEEEGKTISGNDFNKIMNLSESDKFDAFSAALGFDAGKFDAVAEVLAEEEEKKKKEAEDADYVKP